MTISFELEGFELLALNGGPHFKFNPSISLFVICKDQEEIERIWKRLKTDGKEMMPLDSYDWSTGYGWLQDRYGLSWQLILTDPSGETRPAIMPSLLFTGEVCGKAEEAGAFYRSVFEDSRAGQLVRYPAGMEHDREGTVMFSDFRLDRTWFAAVADVVLRAVGVVRAAQPDAAPPRRGRVGDRRGLGGHRTAHQGAGRGGRGGEEGTSYAKVGFFRYSRDGGTSRPPLRSAPCWSVAAWTTPILVS